MLLGHRIVINDVKSLNIDKKASLDNNGENKKASFKANDEKSKKRRYVNEENIFR